MLDCRLKKNWSNPRCRITIDKRAERRLRKFNTFRNRVCNFEPKTQRELDVALLFIKKDLKRIKRG